MVRWPPQDGQPAPYVGAIAQALCSLDGEDLRKHVLRRRLFRRPPKDGRPALARASTNDRGTAVRLCLTLHEDAASSDALMNTTDFQAALQETAHGV